MQRHLKRHHPTEFSSIGNKQPKIAACLQKTAKYPSGSGKQKKLEEKLAHFLAKDLRPASMIEGTGFKDFLQELDPRFALPSRRTVNRVLLPSLWEKEKDKLKTELAKASWVSLTTDMWSSRTNSAFLNITAHFLSEGKLCTKVLQCERFPERHTGDNIKDKLKEVLKDFKVTNKVVTITSDNAANMKNAIKGAGLKELGCMAHTINLSAQDVLDKDPDLKQVRLKIKDIVKAVKTSHALKVELENCQGRLGMPVKNLVRECKTRYCSFISFFR